MHVLISCNKYVSIYCDKKWFLKYDMNLITICKMMHQSKSARLFYLKILLAESHTVLMNEQYTWISITNNSQYAIAY
jgi:hypothetical protein